jgi:hypothetical protein
MDAEEVERFVLAGHLGMTVEELNARLTVSELHRWRRYFRQVKASV